MNAPEPDSEHPNLGYEPRDASLRAIGITVAIVVGSVLASLAISGFYFNFQYARLEPDFTRQTSFTDSANYQTSIAQSWPDLNREVQQNLHTYGWVDEKSGVARIPIDRAMELMAQEATAKSAPQKAAP